MESKDVVVPLYVPFASQFTMEPKAFRQAFADRGLDPHLLVLPYEFARRLRDLRAETLATVLALGTPPPQQDLEAAACQVGTTPDDIVRLQQILAEPVEDVGFEIIPNLFLTAIKEGKDLDWLRQKGITHVVNMCAGEAHIENKMESFTGHKIDRSALWSKRDCSVRVPASGRIPEQLLVNAADMPKFDLSPHFNPTVDFITEALAQPDQRVCVHCGKGVSRSASIVLAYLMKQRGLPLVLAEYAVRLRREQVYPNPGFMAQLERWQLSGYTEAPNQDGAAQK